MRPIVLVMLGLAATCAGPVWGLDINGNTIGMPIDQVAKRYGKRWACDTATDARAGDKVCRKSPAVDEFPRLQNEYFAGNHVAIAYRFHDDRLVQIRVSGIAKDRFDGVLETLTKAYGEPKLEKGGAKDTSEKSSDDTTARWESEGAILDLGNPPKPSAVSLSLYDAAYWKTRSAALKGDGG